MLCSDGSLLDLYHPPNRQNDRVQVNSSSDVPVIETVKQPTKKMVWDMISVRGLSDLHIVFCGKTVTSDYYVDEVLKGLRHLR